MLVAAISALYLQALVTRRRGSRRARRRNARAQRGERNAEALLIELGYEICDRQARLDWTIEVDGAPMTVDLRADLLVERDGRRYVAEVKTGDKAPRLSHAATRRQLLEYRCAYPVDGALLVDVEGAAVSEVDFIVPQPGPYPEPQSLRVSHLATTAILGVLIGASACWWLVS